MLQKRIKSLKSCLEVVGLSCKLILVKSLWPYKKRRERLKKGINCYNKYKQALQTETEEERKKRREEKERIIKQRLLESENKEKRKKIEALNKAARPVANTWLEQLAASVNNKRITFDNRAVRDGVIIIIKCDKMNFYTLKCPYEEFFVKTSEIEQDIKVAISKALKNADRFLKMMEECEKRGADEEPLTEDMGMSVNWAFRNVGAVSASDYGDQYAWGETVPKTSFSKHNYYIGLRLKYTVPALSGTPINLQTEDDAASKRYGKSWRMPTIEEFEELYHHCYITHFYNDDGPNKTNGIAMVSERNGHILYFPAEGEVTKRPLIPCGEASSSSGFALSYKSIYWSSTINLDNPDKAKSLSEYEIPYDGESRFLGGVIRPVREK